MHSIRENFPTHMASASRLGSGQLSSTPGPHFFAVVFILHGTVFAMHGARSDSSFLAWSAWRVEGSLHGARFPNYLPWRSYHGAFLPARSFGWLVGGGWLHDRRLGHLSAYLLCQLAFSLLHATSSLVHVLSHLL